MWYVIQVETGKEKQTCERCKKILSTTNFSNVFVPMYIRKRKYQGIWKEECHVLCPGYVFLDTCEPKKAEEELARLSCMAKPVYIGGEFAHLEADEQKFLTEMMQDNYVIPMSIGYIVDGELKVFQGPLRTQTSHVKRIDRHKRTAEISFVCLTKETKAIIGLEVVAKMTREEFVKNGDMD